MKLRDLLPSRIRALLTRDDPEVVRIPFRPFTDAGELVTAETASRQAVVWACQRYLSSTVAQLPWRVMQPVGANGALPVTNNAVARLLSTRPNPEMTPFAFKETMTWWACSRGNAVAEIQRNNRNEPIGLWPLYPQRVDFSRDDNTGELLYEVTQGKGEPKAILRGADVFHVRGFGHGPVGLDVMAYAAESIGWALATQTFGSSYFGQGVSPAGVFYIKHKFSPGGKDVFEQEIKDKFSGARKAGKVLTVDFEGKFERLMPDIDKTQLVEVRQHQVEEICRWFGVPPHKVMHLLRATFTNIEHQSIEVVVDAITPWCIRFEEEANYKLFGQNRQGLFTKLDIKGLLRGDYKSRQEGLQIQRRNGVINANEWRALEDMNGIGRAGDVYIVEGNMTRLDQVGQQVAPAPAPAGSPAPAPGPTDPAAALPLHVIALAQQLHSETRTVH